MKKKTENQQPYIDYKTATNMTRHFDFINRANRMFREMLTQLNRLNDYLELSQHQINEMIEWYVPVPDTNKGGGAFDNDVRALRTFAQEAGLTRTLFEKLKDDQFRARFTGWLYPPVQQEEIQEAVKK